MSKVSKILLGIGIGANCIGLGFVGYNVFRDVSLKQSFEKLKVEKVQELSLLQNEYSQYQTQYDNTVVVSQKEVQKQSDNITTLMKSLFTWDMKLYDNVRQSVIDTIRQQGQSDDEVSMSPLLSNFMPKGNSTTLYGQNMTIEELKENESSATLEDVSVQLVNVSDGRYMYNVKVKAAYKNMKYIQGLDPEPQKDEESDDRESRRSGYDKPVNRSVTYMVSLIYDGDQQTIECSSINAVR